MECSKLQRMLVRQYPPAGAAYQLMQSNALSVAILHSPSVAANCCHLHLVLVHRLQLVILVALAHGTPHARIMWPQLRGPPEVVQGVEGHAQQLIGLPQPIPCPVVSWVQLHSTPVRLCKPHTGCPGKPLRHMSRPACLMVNCFRELKKNIAPAPDNAVQDPVTGLCRLSATKSEHCRGLVSSHQRAHSTSTMKGHKLRQGCGTNLWLLRCSSSPRTHDPSASMHSSNVCPASVHAGSTSQPTICTSS